MRTPRQDWRGLVNQVVYGIMYARSIDDELIQQNIRELFEQRAYTQPPQAYYEAIRAGLESGEPISELPGLDESVAREFLERLLRGMDAARPWPEVPFVQLDSSAWTELADAPAIATLPFGRIGWQERVSRLFRDSPEGEPVMILRFRSGRTAGFRAKRSFGEKGITVVGRDDPAATIADIRDSIGLSAADLTPIRR